MLQSNVALCGGGQVQLAGHAGATSGLEEQVIQEAAFRVTWAAAS